MSPLELRKAVTPARTSFTHHAKAEQLEEVPQYWMAPVETFLAYRQYRNLGPRAKYIRAVSSYDPTAAFSQTDATACHHANRQAYQ